MASRRGSHLRDKVVRWSRSTRARRAETSRCLNLRLRSCVAVAKWGQARNRRIRSRSPPRARCGAASRPILSPRKMGAIVISFGRGLVADRLLEQCEERARQIVEEHWADIVKVAEALLDCTVLNADDLDALLGNRRDHTLRLLLDRKP